jgi:hypothetical protein
MIRRMKVWFGFFPVLILLGGCSADTSTTQAWVAPVRSAALKVPSTNNQVGFQDNGNIKTGMFTFTSPCTGYLKVSVTSLGGAPNRHWDFIKQNTGEELTQYLFNETTPETNVQFPIRRGVGYILRLTLQGPVDNQKQAPNAIFSTAYQNCM